MFKASTTTPEKRRRKRSLFIWTKRRKFLLSAFLLSFSTILIQAVELSIRYPLIVALAILAGILTWWSLKQDLKEFNVFYAIILPAYFVSSINLFYILLANNIWIKMVLMIVMLLSIYAIYLSENIFIVATQRNIQLLRAAMALGFVFTLVSLFFALESLFAYRFAPWTNFALVFVVSFPIFWQGVWMSSLETKFSAQTLYYALGMSWLVAQAGFLISMWPLTLNLRVLMLITLAYASLGIVQQEILGRLFPKTLKSYIRVAILMLISVYFSAGWGRVGV